MAEPGGKETKSAGTGIPAAEAMKLLDLADYAEGSIVSRTLVDSRAGTVTLFAFDAGQVLREHSTPFDAVVQVLEGRARFTVGGRNVPGEAGDVVILPADVPHAVEAAGRFKMLLTMVAARGKESDGACT